MFTTSLGGLLLALGANILLPLLPGILFLRIFFGKKFSGALLYLLSRFIGVGVVAHRLFNLQFVRFGIGIGEYIALLALLLGIFFVKLVVTQKTLKEYVQLLRISFPWTEAKASFQSLSKGERFLAVLAGAVGAGFVITSFVFTVNLPTYADDSFGNRNRPIVHILDDGGVKLFGAKDEILARARLGYPIHIPIYKSLIAEVQGGYNDIYVDLFQWLCLLFAAGFIVAITRESTKNILYTLIPVGLICSLPLVFIHTIEGYHDLPVTLYAILALRFFYTYAKTHDLSLLTGGLLVGSLLSYIKIEGLIIYFPAMLVALGMVFLLEGTLWGRLRELLTSRKHLLTALGYIVFFLLPFQIVRIYHGLGFNPSSLESGEVLDKTVHREIFDQFSSIFFQEDNYGIALVISLLSLYVGGKLLQKKKYLETFLILTPVVMFVLFTLVFLLTNNYQRVLNQTTVNRVYTMCFVLLFAFIGCTMDEYA